MLGANLSIIEVLSPMHVYGQMFKISPSVTVLVKASATHEMSKSSRRIVLHFILPWATIVTRGEPPLFVNYCAPIVVRSKLTLDRI